MKRTLHDLTTGLWYAAGMLGSYGGRLHAAFSVHTWAALVF